MKKITFLILGLTGVLFVVGAMAEAESVLTPGAKVVKATPVVAEVELIELVLPPELSELVVMPEPPIKEPEPDNPAPPADDKDISFTAPAGVGGVSGYVRPLDGPFNEPNEPTNVEQVYVYKYVDSELAYGEVTNGDRFTVAFVWVSDDGQTRQEDFYLTSEDYQLNLDVEEEFDGSPVVQFKELTTADVGEGAGGVLPAGEECRALSCPADLDGDGQVGQSDLGILLSQWGKQGEGDTNDDGVVDEVDLDMLIQAWGPCSLNTYLLGGYSVGNSLEEAIGAERTSEPLVVDLGEPVAAKYLIAWNEKCVTGDDDDNGGDGGNDPDGNNTGGGGGGGNSSHYTNSNNSAGGSLFDEGQGEVLGEVLGTVACEPYLSDYVKYGGNNNDVDVIRLQAMLNRRMGARLPVTGFYGEKTRRMTSLFQVLYGDEILQPWVDIGLHASKYLPTGYVYKTTRRWINMLECPGSFEPIPLLP